MNNERIRQIEQLFWTRGEGGDLYFQATAFARAIEHELKKEANAVEVAPVAIVIDDYDGWTKVRMLTPQPAGTKLYSTPNGVNINADRYEKLRRWMGSNVQDGWSEVEKLASVVCYMGYDEFDLYLDNLPVCNVGLSHVRGVDMGSVMDSRYWTCPSCKTQFDWQDDSNSPRDHSESSCSKGLYEAETVTPYPKESAKEKFSS